MKQNRFSVFLAGVIGVIYSGCSDGGVERITFDGNSSSAITSISTISGIVSDGPIANARVFIDENFNGTYDLGEHYDITDENGSYEINYILEPGTKYILIAEGSPELNTTDTEDHPNEQLDFVMASSLNASGRKNIDPPTGSSYKEDITPSSFKGYLQSLDSDYSQALSNSDSNLSALISTNETNETYLFDTFIKSNKNIISQTLQDVAEALDEQNSQNDLALTKNQLGLNGDNTISFIDKNASELSQSLTQQNKTLPSKLGPVSISKELTKIESSQSDYSVFVSTYENILQIPDYKKLKDANLSVVYGADITLKDENGSKVISTDAQIIQDILNSLDPSSINIDALSYLYYDGSDWIDSGINDINISDSGISGLNTINTRPFILAKSQNIQEASRIRIPNVELLEDIAVILKGHYTNSSVSSESKRVFPSNSTKNSVMVDAVLLDENKEIWSKIPNDFVIDSVVLVGEELKELQSNGLASVSVDIEDGYGDMSNNINFITNENLLDLLRTGSGVNDTKGIQGMIQSKLLFEILPLNMEDDSISSNALSAKNILSSNIDSFLNKQNIFTDNNQSTLSWSQENVSSTFSIDKTKKTITLNETSTKQNDPYTKEISWAFENGKITKKLQKSIESGFYNGTSYNRSVSFETDKNVTVATFSDTRNVVYKNDSGYNSSLEGAYEGTALLRLDSEYNVDSIKSAKMFQKHTETNVNSGTNTLNALVKFTDTNLSLENSFFSFHTSEYGDIEGSVLVEFEDAVYAKQYSSQTQSFSNDNTIVKAVFKSPAAIFQEDIEYFSNLDSFSDSWIKNKVLYQVVSEDNGTSWDLNKFTFGTVSLSVGEGINGLESVHHDYNISTDGYIEYNGTNIAIKNTTDNRLEICQGSSVLECKNSSNGSMNYLYLNSKKANNSYVVRNITGIHSGEISDSCSDNNGSLMFSISTDTQTWSASSQDGSRFYGTEIELDGKSLTLMDGNEIWAEANVSNDFSSISGEWSSGNCSGQFNISAQ